DPVRGRPRQKGRQFGREETICPRVVVQARPRKKEAEPQGHKQTAKKRCPTSPQYEGCQRIEAELDTEGPGRRDQQQIVERKVGILEILYKGQMPVPEAQEIEPILADEGEIGDRHERTVDIGENRELRP